MKRYIKSSPPDTYNCYESSDCTFKIMQNITNATNDITKCSAYIDVDLMFGNY